MFDLTMILNTVVASFLILFVYLYMFYPKRTSMNELNQVCYYQYNDELLFINNIIFNCDIKNENNIIIKNIILLVPLIIDSSCCTNKYNENAANKNTIHTIENCNDNAMIFI